MKRHESEAGLRIMMLSHGYPPTVSGVTLVVQKVSRSLVAGGNEVVVITASDRGVPYEYDDQGVKVVRVRGLKNRFWKEGPLPYLSRVSFRELIARYQPDIIHTHENVIFNLLLLKLHPELRIPIVSSCYFLPRFITHYMYFGAWGNRKLRGIIWKYIIHSLNQYDQVIFSTRTQRKDFIDHGLLARAVVISNGVDTSRYHGKNGFVEPAVLSRLPAGPRVLFVGRLMKDKRIDLLIEAMVQVNRVTPANLLVVGRGDERGELERLRDSLGLKDRVHFLGFVPEEDLPALYRASDLFAIASVCEVQSIPALQAAATGLPIVAADAAALPELVVPEVNGYLVKPGDSGALGEAILKVLSDRELAQTFGKASLEISAEHAEITTFKEYEQFYRQVLELRGQESAGRTSAASDPGSEPEAVLPATSPAAPPEVPPDAP